MSSPLLATVHPDDAASVPFLVIRSSSKASCSSSFDMQDIRLSTREGYLLSVKLQIQSEQVKVQNVM